MYINPSNPSGHCMNHEFNFQQLYVLPTEPYVCILRGSENKQRLFRYTSLTGWFYNRGGKCLVCGTSWIFKRNGCFEAQIIGGRHNSP
jgi:hypothetical protein